MFVGLLCRFSATRAGVLFPRGRGGDSNHVSMLWHMFNAHVLIYENKRKHIFYVIVSKDKPTANTCKFTNPKWKQLG